MRRYESLFILHPELVQEEMQEVVDKFQHIITRDKGKIIKTDPLGIRKLSFDIQKQSRGFYVLLDYAGEPEIIKELERNFRIDERVLNYQTIKLKNTISEEEIEALIAQQSPQPSEQEEGEETPPEQRADLDVGSQEEAAQNDTEKMETPHPEETVDEAQPERIEEEK